jgi:hypothetical protein
VDYLFAKAVEKAREHGYSSLAEHERWDWHGDVYGFRRVIGIRAIGRRLIQARSFKNDFVAFPTDLTMLTSKNRALKMMRHPALSRLRSCYWK